MQAKNRLRAVYAGTALAVLALVGGYVLAASSVTVPGPAQTTNVTSTSPSGFSTAVVSSSAVVIQSSTTVGYAALGTQSASTGGLAGTTTALAGCTATCAENDNPATQTNPATVGNYAEQVVIAVQQPIVSAGPTGFDAQISVSITASGVASTAVAEVYVSTGTTTASSAVTVDVYLFVDLGTTNAPAIDTVNVVFNACSSSTTCP
jgi:hypothetical protein